MTLGILPPMLRSWHRAYEGVRVRLFEHRHADELAEAMLAGQADLAIGPPPRIWDGPVRPLGEEEFVVVLPPGDAAVPAAATPAAPARWAAVTRPAAVT
ncbi:LysR family transcriptional regulator substrate-binding protein [Frankia sp. AiPs1]|nr:LysR family transcriptional regulator substrate-binding protein [Frankia sp. AiPs1]